MRLASPGQTLEMLFFSLFGLVEPDNMPPLHLVPDFAKFFLKMLFGIYMMVTLIVGFILKIKIFDCLGVDQPLDCYDVGHLSEDSSPIGQRVEIRESDIDQADEQEVGNAVTDKHVDEIVHVFESGVSESM